VADAAIALQAAVGLRQLSEKQLAAADINKDGQISITDAIAILKIALKIPG
jgi:hypothetical protein